MQSFTYHCPTEIIFGRGAEDAVPAKLRAAGARRVLILHGGGSAERSGLLSRIEMNLTSAGLAFLVMGGVQPNPRVAFVARCVRPRGDPRGAHSGCEFHPCHRRRERDRLGEGGRSRHRKS